MENAFKYDLSYTQNRELSWLNFNVRVLNEAFEPDVPPLEKLKFIAIFTSNLTEFFMVRVGSLNDLVNMKKQAIDNKTGLTSSEQLDAIYKKMPDLYKQKDEAYTFVSDLLKREKIVNSNYDQLDKVEKKYVDTYFENRILPVISPLILDSRHPFPFLSNNQPVVIAEMKRSKESEDIIGLVQKPQIVPDVIFIPGDGIKYILTVDLIKSKLSSVFKEKITNSLIISVTRNADIILDDELDDFDEDFRKHMKKALKKRNRLEPVRLEVKGNPSKKLLTFLLNHLNLKENQVFYSKSPLELSYAFTLFGKLNPEEKKKITYEDYNPIYPYDIDQNKSIIEQVVEKDRLLFFPYQSMEPFLSMLKEASNDPTVISIKITIYRLASISKVAEYLANAAENGKEVVAVMELRARFDERNNIDWSERLEEAGCTVIYGFEEYKIHSKICLITRQKNQKLQYISQFGTGNYNEKTAKMYTDLSLLTADQKLGEDANRFFRNMTTSTLDGKYDHILVAPNSLEPALIKMIDEQIEITKTGGDGLIRIKCNSITERKIIDKLQEASKAGVKIFLNVRGICCLLPGIKGKTENIKITSTIGRYLEHPRIYIFGQNDEAKVYISSADLMTRNLARRVEIACPIYDYDLKNRIIKIMDIILKDDKNARTLTSNGEYIREVDNGTLVAQDEFMKITQKESENKINSSKNTVHKKEFKKTKSNQEIFDLTLSKMTFWEKIKKLFFS